MRTHVVLLDADAPECVATAGRRLPPLLKTKKTKKNKQKKGVVSTVDVAHDAFSRQKASH